MIFVKSANVGKGQSVEPTGLGQVDIHMQRNEIRPLFHTKYTNKTPQNVPNTYI